MFEQISRGISSSDVVTTATNVAGVNILSLDDAPRKLRVSFSTLDLKQQYDDYQNSVRLCIRAITDHLSSREHGLGPRDYALRSPNYIAKPVTAATGSKDDKNEKRATDADADAFVEDVGNTLLFVVIALIRHDIVPFDSRFDSINYETTKNENERRCRRMLRYDEKFDSYVILLQQLYAHVYRVKLSVTQIKGFLSHMVDLWNERIGIVNFEQLGALLLSLYRIFPAFRSSQEENHLSPSSSTISRR